MARMNRPGRRIFWSNKDRYSLFERHFNTMNTDLTIRLKQFIESEARSCSMDPGCITPEYVYRMWGGTVSLEEIEKALNEIK